MKLLFLLFLILTLSSCSGKNAISNTMYVGSIGIEYRDSTYHVSYLVPADSKAQKQTVGTEEGKTIEEVFQNLKLSTSLDINLSHVSSLVLHESAFHNKQIDDCIEYILNHPETNFNFYLFSTKDKIEDLFLVEPPSEEGAMLTPLLEPVYSNDIYLDVKPVHFLNFIKKYYENKEIEVPFIEKKDVWTDKSSIEIVSKAIFYNDSLKIAIND